VLPLLNKFARVPVSGLIAQYNAWERATSPTGCRHHAPDPVEEPDGARLHQTTNLPPSTIPRSCVKSVPASRVAASATRGLRQRSGEGVRSLHRMLEGRNFGKLIVRVGA